MKTYALTGIGQMQLLDIPMPVIRSDNDVLIRMKVVGICGSDIHYYTQGRIGNQIVKYPFTVGHEGAGIIEQVGSSVKNLNTGDRIAIEPAMPCYHCDQCKIGRYHTCRNLVFLGCPGQAEGCLSEFIVMPASCCHPIPESMSLIEAALSEPLAIGVYAVHRAKLESGYKIGILGYGPIGMSIHLAAKREANLSFFITDKIIERLDVALNMGAEFIANPTTSDVEKQIMEKAIEELDIVFECCGQQEAFENALHLLKPGGTLVLVGIPEFDFWRLPVDTGRRKELSIIHIRRQNGMLEKTLAGIADKSFQVSRMLTHRFCFSETQQAYELVRNYSDGVMKAVIEI
jgi:L-iditol 2-dehydrogenase